MTTEELLKNFQNIFDVVAVTAIMILVSITINTIIIMHHNGERVKEIHQKIDGSLQELKSEMERFKSLFSL